MTQRRPYVVTQIRPNPSGQGGVRITQAVANVNWDDIQRIIRESPEDASVRFQPDYTDSSWGTQ